MNFKHSGARGDIIYSLPTIKALLKANNCESANLYISTDESGVYVGKPMSLDDISDMAELLVTQEYIKNVYHYNGQKIDFDLDDFRKIINGEETKDSDGHLASIHLVSFDVDYDLSLPWIDNTNFDKVSLAEIAICRSSRYHDFFPWDVLSEYLDKCIFIGYEEEHEAFVKETGMPVKYHKPSSIMNIAEIISGAKLFIGNQSFPYSIAEAMKIPRVLEVCSNCPNCNPKDERGHITLNKEIIESALSGEIIKSNEDERSAFFSSNPRLNSTKNVKNSKVSCVIVVDKNEIGIDRTKIVVDNCISSGHEVVILWMCDDKPFDVDCEIIITDNIDKICKINEAVSKTNGDFICLIEDTFINQNGILDLLKCFNNKYVGLAGQKISLEGYPHICRGALMISRRAFNDCNLFNPEMTDFGWHGVEIYCRFTQKKYQARQARSKNISVFFEELNFGNDAIYNEHYILNRYGIKLFRSESLNDWINFKNFLLLRTNVGLREAIALTTVIKEFKRRNPNIEILIETKFVDVFLNNPNVSLVSDKYINVENRNAKNSINLDLLSVIDWDGHAIDLISSSIINDTNLLSHKYEIYLNRIERNEVLNKFRNICGKNIFAIDFSIFTSKEIDDLMTQFKIMNFDVIDVSNMPLRIAFGVIEKCDLYIGGDCDVSYMAMATETPIIVSMSNRIMDKFVPIRGDIPFNVINIPYSECKFYNSCESSSFREFGRVYSQPCKNKIPYACNHYDKATPILDLVKVIF